MVKKSLANAGDKNLIPSSGKSPGEGNGNPLQWVGNSMDRKDWWVIVYGVTKDADMA